MASTSTTQDMLAKIFIAVHTTNPVNTFQSSHYWSFSFSRHGSTHSESNALASRKLLSFGLCQRSSVFSSSTATPNFRPPSTAASIDALRSPTRSYQVSVATISQMLKAPRNKQLRTFSLDLPPKLPIV